jgi:hypothetical protein
LAHAAQLNEFAKNQFDGLLHAMVGILFQFPAQCPTETDGDLNLQLAARGFLANGFHRPLAKEIQLEFADCTFHPQEQPIIG